MSETENDLAASPLGEVTALRAKLTELKSELEALKQNSAHYKNIIDTSMDGFWLTDARGRFLDVNDSYCKMLGYSRNELLNMSIPDVEASEQPEETAAHIQKLMKTGSDRFETRHRRKDGTAMDIEVSANFMDTDGGRLFVFLRDISERNYMLARLKESAASLAKAQEIGRMGNWQWDIAGSKLTWSEQTYKIFDLDPNGPPITFHRFMDFVHPDDREALTLSIDDAIARKSDKWNFEYRIVLQDGTVKSVHEEARTVTDETGRPIKRIGIVQDITESKKAEEVLRDFNASLQAEVRARTADLEAARVAAESANVAKSALLANMSHELKTPLNAIIGFSNILADGMAGPLNDEQKDYAMDIQESAERLLGLINNLLALSNIELGRQELKLSEFHVKVLVKESMAMLKQTALKRKVTLLSDIRGDVGFVIADEKMIRQTLLNLISNAIKYSPEGGCVTIHALKESNGKGESIKISVEDTGMGIPPEDIIRLFTPFEQLEQFMTKSHDGVGVGLYLSKRLVELHSGQIWAESQPGTGSVFTFTLPVR